MHFLLDVSLFSDNAKGTFEVEEFNFQLVVSIKHFNEFVIVGRNVSYAIWIFTLVFKECLIKFEKEEHLGNQHWIKNGMFNDRIALSSY